MDFITAFQCVAFSSPGKDRALKIIDIGVAEALDPARLFATARCSFAVNMFI